MRKLVCLLAVFGVLVAGSTAQALKITNGATTVFDAGGFEGETDATVPSNPTTGSWETDAAGGQHYATTAGTPGANEGTKYLAQIGSVTADQMNSAQRGPNGSLPDSNSR